MIAVDTCNIIIEQKIEIVKLHCPVSSDKKCIHKFIRLILIFIKLKLS